MSTADRSAPSRDEDLLDSWKSIAAYLGRSVRAAQKWEKSEGLPVHRQHHEKQGSVYAYRSELEAWIEARRTAAPSERQPAWFRRTAFRWALAIAAAAVLAVAVWWMGRDSGRSELTALGLQGRDYVLVSALENGTGEEIFDGALEYLLERELAESPRFDVVPQERVADVLQLMRRNADTRVDRTLAREIAMRDGGIRAIAAPRLEKLGGRYVLGLDLLDPRSGARIARFDATAAGHDGIHGAARTLADRLRAAAGEQMSTSPSGHPPMERVTSRSLRAVQIFTQADRRIAFRNDAAAESLLRQSIEEDPEFASAHMHLAFAIYNQRKPAAEYLPHARRAAELAGRTSERERFFINGSVALMEGRRDEALEHYRALLELDPNHLWANNNISNILRQERRFREAVPFRVRLAELRPNEFIANFMAAESLAHWSDRPEAARPFFRRAETLITHEDETHFARQVVWTRLEAATVALLAGNRQAAIRELDRWTARARSRRGPSSDGLLASIGDLELLAGRRPEAERVASLINDPLERLRYEARLALMTGRYDEARRRFERLLSESNLPYALDLLLAAQAGAADSVSRAMNRARLSPESSQAIFAELAIARGDRAKGIALYEEAMSRSEEIGGRLLPFHLAAAGSLARALEAEGERDRAVAVIESARRHRNRLLSDSLPFWFALEQQMIRLDSGGQTLS